MIGDPVLRKIIRADLVASVTALHHEPPLRRNRRCLLGYFLLIELHAQHLHRAFAVLKLRPLLLASHDDPGRPMSNPDRRLDLIDVLPTLAAGAVGSKLK